MKAFEMHLDTETNPPPPHSKPHCGKREGKTFVRDPLDSKLGGVCSGIARYFDCDPTWIRLGIVFVVLASFFLHCVCIQNAAMDHHPMAYVILWIVVPEAKTPVEKMQMMGRDPYNGEHWENRHREL